MKILMVCTGNTCRSSMAEAIAKDMVEKFKAQGLKNTDFEISSAGTSTMDDFPMSKEALDVLAEMNIDGGSHRSRQLTKEILDDSDLVLTMQKKHKELVERAFGKRERLYTLNEFAGSPGEIKDPFGSDMDFYREIRDEIEYQLERCFKRLM